MSRCRDRRSRPGRAARREGVPDSRRWPGSAEHDEGGDASSADARPRARVRGRSTPETGGHGQPEGGAGRVRGESSAHAHSSASSAAADQRDEERAAEEGDHDAGLDLARAGRPPGPTMSAASSRQGASSADSGSSQRWSGPIASIRGDVRHDQADEDDRADDGDGRAGQQRDRRTPWTRIRPSRRPRAIATSSPSARLLSAGAARRGPGPRRRRGTAGSAAQRPRPGRRASPPTRTGTGPARRGR